MAEADATQPRKRRLISPARRRHQKSNLEKAVTFSRQKPLFRGGHGVKLNEGADVT